MMTITREEAEGDFEQLIRNAQDTPIGIVSDGTVVSVMLGAASSELVRQFHAQRLRSLMDDAAAQIERACLTPDALRSLCE